MSGRICIEERGTETVGGCRRERSRGLGPNKGRPRYLISYSAEGSLLSYNANNFPNPLALLGLVGDLPYARHQPLA